MYCGPVSVCHKFLNSVITATHIIMQTTPHGSPGTLSDDKRLGEISVCQGMWGGKNLRLSTDNKLISKMVQGRHMVYKTYIWFIWKVKRKSYALFRMVTLLMTLSDPNHCRSPPCVLCFGSSIYCTILLVT